MDLFTLKNAKGMEAAITNYGAIVVSLKTPDRNGKMGDVVLGFDSLDGYLGDNPYFGAIVGRYGNRIAKGRFTLNGSNTSSLRITDRMRCMAVSKVSIRLYGRRNRWASPA